MKLVEIIGLNYSKVLICQYLESKFEYIEAFKT